MKDVPIFGTEEVPVIPGMWKHDFVRPYESLWSIIHNYTSINALQNYETAESVLKINLSHKNQLHCEHGIFTNINLSDSSSSWKNLKRLLPAWYVKQMDDINNRIPLWDAFSINIRYCPECMKHSYHSVFHQLQGVKKCLIHDKNLVAFNLELFLVGHQSFYSIMEGPGSKRLKRGAFHRMTNMFAGPNPDFSKDYYELPFPCVIPDEIGDFSEFNDLYERIMSIHDVSYSSINEGPYGLDTHFADFLQKNGYDDNLMDLNAAVTLHDIAQAYNTLGEDISKIIFFGESHPIKRWDNDSFSNKYEYLFFSIIFLLIKDLFYCFPQDDIILQFRKMHYGMKMDSSNELVTRILFIESMMGERIAELLIGSGRIDGSLFNEAMNSFLPESEEYEMPFVQLVNVIYHRSINKKNWLQVFCTIVCDIIKDCYEYFRTYIAEKIGEINGFQDSVSEEIALHMHEYAIVNYLGEEGDRIYKILKNEDL